MTTGQHPQNTTSMPPTVTAPSERSSSGPAPTQQLWFRVGLLLLSGGAIAFTAPLHHVLSFDTTLTMVTWLLLAVAHTVEWRTMRSAKHSLRVSPISMLLAVTSLGAALALFWAETSTAFAVIVAAWALISGLLEYIAAVTRPGERPDAYLLGTLGVFLALLSLLVREDPIAVLGFFGAYTVIAGVFLGISAVDRQRTVTPGSEQTAQQQ